MIQLLATPERFDGKLIDVVGFVTFGIDGDWLFLDKQHYENGIRADAIWFDGTKDMARHIKELDHNYVRVVGIFRNDASPLGYATRGHIVKIRECQMWSQPDHPRTQQFREMQGAQPKQEH